MSIERKSNLYKLKSEEPADNTDSLLNSEQFNSGWTRQFMD